MFISGVIRGSIFIYKLKPFKYEILHFTKNNLDFYKIINKTILNYSNSCKDEKTKKYYKDLSKVDILQIQKASVYKYPLYLKAGGFIFDNKVGVSTGINYKKSDYILFTTFKATGFMYNYNTPLKKLLFFRR